MKEETTITVYSLSLFSYSVAAAVETITDAVSVVEMTAAASSGLSYFLAAVATETMASSVMETVAVAAAS